MRALWPAAGTARLGGRRSPFLGPDPVQHWWTQKEIHQIRVELCSAPFSQQSLAFGHVPATVIAACVGDGIERVRDRNDARGEWDRLPLQSTGIAAAVPSLVVRQYSFGKLGVERCERAEHGRTAFRVNLDPGALFMRQLAVVVNDVEKGFVDLADIVEESDALDVVERALVQSHRVGKHQGITRDPADMRSCDGIVGIDGVEQGFERGGAEPLQFPGSPQPLNDEDGAGRHDCRGPRHDGQQRVEALHAGDQRKNHVPWAMTTDSNDAIAIVSMRGARRWERGHPWIFRSDVAAPPHVAAGAVRVRDQRGRGLGVALWSPESEISLRLLDIRPEARIDRDWWRHRIALASERRQSLAGQTDAWRVVHGEGDALPALIVDRYGKYLVVQLMSAGVEAFRSQIVDVLMDLFDPAGILARNDAGTRSREGLTRETVVLAGDVPREVEVTEHGIRYLVAPWTGQKTGAFLDQRESRRLMGSVARGEALDCFSYHGSFALHLARGATQVTALDVSGAALSRARENAALNGLTNISFVEADTFDFLREQERNGKRFDTIVLDPPAFAKNRQSIKGALRGYKDINLRAMRLLHRGGLLYTASCSFHLSRSAFLEMLRDAASDSGRRMILREVTGQPVDHPELLTVPETGYLKGALLEAGD